MAGAEDRSHGSDSFPIKLPSFIPNLFPFLKPKPTATAKDDTKTPKPTAVSGDGDSQISTFDTVSFPKNPPMNNTEPLKFEAEPNSSRTSNNIVLWQVYALGGFLVLKWAWARWNERNKGIDKKDDGNDEPSHEDDDDQPSLGHED